jgi:hypothetical protein
MFPISPVWRLLAIGGVWMLMAGCTTHYRNSLNPSYGQAEFDRDLYECRRENTFPRATRLGSYSDATMEVNEDMAKACLAARGWRPVTEATTGSAPPPSKPVRYEGCGSGMYWNSSKNQCVKIGE